MTCCRSATAEEIEAEPDLFDCETCPRRLMEAELGSDDWRALRLYDLLRTRVVQELRLVPLVFDALRLQMSQTDALMLVNKLVLIHEARSPLPAPGASAGEH